MNRAYDLVAAESREIHRLERCINDLISLLALPALWTGSDASRVLGILLDVLVRILSLDFAYARSSGPVNSANTEICRIAEHRSEGPQAQKIGKLLEPWLDLDGSGPMTGVPNPLGGGKITIARAWLGLGRERGIVVAASSRTDFPDDIESLLLKTAVNQAIIELLRAEMQTERTRSLAVEQMKNHLLAENTYLRREFEDDQQWKEIIGKSKPLQDLLGLVRQVAPTHACVLIEGETGTGKELIARAIHRASARKEQAFVKLNCAAIPAGILESELFGHEKGAFTGAVGQRVGRFELAHRGTIFLDEVGEIPLELQVKLLRVLQEQEFERLGGTRTIRVDVRLIAATNRNLEKMIREETFRSDLYYRLNVFPLAVPPLRERTEDIPQLVRHFTDRHARHYNKCITSIPEKTMAALCHYHWPGNIREMANLIERGVILSESSTLDIPLSELKTVNGNPVSNLSLRDFEREHILRALHESRWVISGPSGAARRLGMKRTSLQYKMQKLGIVRPR
ncbi:MAG: sigma 54-interacting transcriptional regulator [Gammaproteobacteria bacterium]